MLAYGTVWRSMDIGLGFTPRLPRPPIACELLSFSMWQILPMWLGG
jgi:hypothetical protein